MARGELLLEVRAEEIPARMLAPAVRELGTRVFEELMARNLPPREVVTGWTPRRLILILKGLAEREPDREERVWGPPVAAAYDAAGEPTAALLGFARRCDVEPGDLARETKDGRGEYLVAHQGIAGRPTLELLAEILPRVLTGLAWPKTMRWGSGRGPWIRPVHGVVALLGEEVVPFTLFDVPSGRESAGHPILSPRPFTVRGSADHLRKLARRGIVPTFDRRREKLVAGLAAEARRARGKLVDDPALVDRLTAICEIPGVVRGEFDPEFLELPREVLATTLRDHQSALTIERQGRLLPVFLTVMDRSDDPQGRVRSGNEWVVAARLADARFFYREDRRTALGDRRSALRSLIFHELLGSFADKATRLERLVAAICDELGWDEERASAVEAAGLLKADLTTAMVREFTSLQGIVGGIYGREEGLAEPVWQAIYDQYLPASTDDPIPRGRLGRVVALADRIDTLVGMFGVGLVPSGSKDPFGLRRAAQAVVRIALEGDLPLDLDLMCAKATLLYEDRLRHTPEEILAVLRPFLDDRLRHLLGLQGFAFDEIEAALVAGEGSLPDLRARVEALHRIREETDFLAVVLAAKRIANIIRDAPEQTLQPERLVEEAEVRLHRAWQELRGEVEEAVGERDYERCFRRIAEFAGVLDRFFVEVLVMDEDPQLRQNRIALLQGVHRTLARTAGLTEMVVDKAELRSKDSQPA